MYRITAVNGNARTVIHEPDPDSSVRLASGQFAEEVNQISSFEFSILPDNPVFSEGLSDRKTVIEVLNTLTDEIEFEGPLLRSGEKMTAAGKVYKSCICEGCLGYLCDSVQPYHHYESSTVTEFLSALLENHNAQTSEEKHIYLGSCDFSGDNTNSKTTAYRNTLEEIKVNLIDRIGGEIRIRKVDGRLVLDFLTRYGINSGTTIELAKNIQSLEASTDPSNIITRLIPLGYQPDPGESAERLDISSVNEGKLYIDDEAAAAKYGIIVGTAVFDDITLPENLLAAGKKYLLNNNRVKKAYAGQVLDLSVLDPSEQSLRAGNTYHFRNSLIGLDEDLRLMKRTVDIYKPYKPTVEIGDRAERITDVSVRTAKLIEYEMPKQKQDILASAKATATDLIKAGINGYVVVNENEICIMDTPDKSTASKVWRWNSGGFGYSNTGYNGTYGTAMTMNGAIVADFITAGVLRGLEIINGSGTFHVDTDGNVSASSMSINNGSGTFRVLPNGTVKAQAIEITGGKINMTTDSENYDAITLHCKEWTAQLTPLQLMLTNSSIDKKVVIQAGAIYFYDSISASESVCSVSSSTGDIFSKGTVYAGGAVHADGNISSSGDVSASGNVYADALRFNWNGNTYDTGTLISALWNEVFGGGM